MPILQQKPVTPSGRFYLKNKVEVSKKRPEKSLTKGHHRKKGRNTYGRITSRRRGGGHRDYLERSILGETVLTMRPRLLPLSMIQTVHLILHYWNMLTEKKLTSFAQKVYRSVMKLLVLKTR